MLQKKGRIWTNAQRRSGNQEKEEEDSPEKLGNREEGKRRVKRLSKEFDGRERFRKNGLDPHRTSGEEESGTSQKRAEKEKDERIFWKEGLQNTINKACTYIEKKRASHPQQSVSSK